MCLGFFIFKSSHSLLLKLCIIELAALYFTLKWEIPRGNRKEKLPEAVQARPSEISAACLLHPVAPDCLKISCQCPSKWSNKNRSQCSERYLSYAGCCPQRLAKIFIQLLSPSPPCRWANSQEAEWLLRVQSQARTGQRAQTSHSAKPKERAAVAHHNLLPAQSILPCFLQIFHSVWRPSIPPEDYNVRDFFNKNVLERGSLWGRVKMPAVLFLRKFENELEEMNNLGTL